MQFESSFSLARHFRIAGYISAFFLSSTILYFVLGFLDKLPASFTYLHVAAILVLVVVTGEVLTYVLS